MRTGEYPDDWGTRRKQVLERDEYECQQCGTSQGPLQVHHITPISEGGGHDTGNLETVCRACHAGEHPTLVKISTALGENRRLRMKYRSSSGTRIREVDPYGLAMHEGIQYLVGHDSYRDEIRIFRPTRITWAKLLDETFTPPGDWDTEAYLAKEMGYRRTTGTAGDGCFIATAAYGTSAAPEIDELRRFRDEVLARYRATRWLIPTYYALSPPLARWINTTERRRRRARRYVVSPLVQVAKRIRGGGR